MQKKSCKKAEINVPKLVVGTGKGARLIGDKLSLLEAHVLDGLC